VHGFNTTFRDAIFALAQITWDTKYTGIPVVFSWPSQGNIDFLGHPDQAFVAYNYDGASARFSQNSFLELLHLLQSTAHITQLYVIAHSMGNQIVVNALDQANFAGQKHFLNEVVLAAPDVDEDIFKQSVKQLVESANGITLYASAADKALLFSVKWNGQNRAGFIPQGGPFTFTGIDTIDVTAVGDDMLGLDHDVYSTSRPVLEDIGQILKSGTHPPDSRSTDIRTYPEGSKQPSYWVFPR
jgi:esterase/lipase superfamily enzyme